MFKKKHSSTFNNYIVDNYLICLLFIKKGGGNVYDLLMK